MNNNNINNDYIRILEQSRENLFLLKISSNRMKDDLSEFINHGTDPSLIEKAKQFNQLFIEKNIIISFLNSDINTLLSEISHKKLFDTWHPQYVKIKNDIDMFIYEFRRIQFLFTAFIMDEYRIN